MSVLSNFTPEKYSNQFCQGHANTHTHTYIQYIDKYTNMYTGHLQKLRSPVVLKTVTPFYGQDLDQN